MRKHSVIKKIKNKMKIRFNALNLVFNIIVLLMIVVPCMGFDGQTVSLAMAIAVCQRYFACHLCPISFVFRMAIQKEIWQNHIIGGIYRNNEFFKEFHQHESICQRR